MEAFVATQPSMSGSTDFDKILASINAGISGYLNPAVAAAPAPPPAAAVASSGTNWLFLVVIAAGVYVLIH